LASKTLTKLLGYNMNENTKLQNCLNCNRSENEIPLVTLSYSGKPTFICSHCLPMLIHHPEMLIGKIEGAENIPPAEHQD
jgi:hypothetical protein